RAPASHLSAMMWARGSAEAATDTLEACARRQSAYLRTLADDEGRLPLIGDDDGGQLFRFGDRSPADASVSLSVAPPVLGAASLGVRPPSSEVFWILGKRPDVGVR